MKIREESLKSNARRVQSIFPCWLFFSDCDRRLRTSQDLVFFQNSTSSDYTNTTAGVRVCNTVSTGAILLADILPSLAIKITAPFLPFIVQWVSISLLFPSARHARFFRARRSSVAIADRDRKTKPRAPQTKPVVEYAAPYPSLIINCSGDQLRDPQFVFCLREPRRSCVIIAHDYRVIHRQLTFLDRFLSACSRRMSLGEDSTPGYFVMNN